MGHAPDSPANVHVAQTRMTPGVRNQLKDVNGLQVVACVILAAFYQNVALGAGEQFFDPTGDGNIAALVRLALACLRAILRSSFVSASVRSDIRLTLFTKGKSIDVIIIASNVRGSFRRRSTLASCFCTER